MQVATASFTSQISVVRWGDETDRLGGAGKHITDVVGQPLQEVRSEFDLVVDNIVMRWARRALKTAVRYAEMYVSVFTNTTRPKTMADLARKSQIRTQQRHHGRPPFLVWDCHHQPRSAPRWDRSACDASCRR